MFRNRYSSVRVQVDELLTADRGGRSGYYTDWIIVSLIVANVIAVALETINPLYEEYTLIFYWFEMVSVAVFSVEYLTRIWACTARSEYQHPVFGRLTFARRPMLLIDLLAILPFFLGPVLPADLRFLRALRLFRFFRLLKLARYSSSMAVFIDIYHRKKTDLAVAFSATMILLVVASSLMYFVETSAQPDKFSSIPETLWWGVITLTTVGYGDVTPVTPLGRLIGAIMAILGIMVFALPASILASGFIERIEEQKSPTCCPHCGKRVDD